MTKRKQLVSEVNKKNAGCSNTLQHQGKPASLPLGKTASNIHQHNNTMSNNNFQGLQAHIAGQEFDIAQSILGLADGKGNGHTQACPVCGGGKNGDRFYFRSDTCTFHCKKCTFALDIFDLIAKVRGVTRDEAFGIVAAEVGYVKSDDIIESAVSESVVEQQDTASVEDIDVGAVTDLPMLESYVGSVEPQASTDSGILATVKRKPSQSHARQPQDCGVAKGSSVASEQTEIMQDNAVEKYANAVVPIAKGQYNAITNRRDFQALKDFIVGREWSLAKQIVRLTDGKQSDHEHHQPCPKCSGEDRFYYRKESATFHCRQCNINGDIFELIQKIFNYTPAEAFDAVASAAGYFNNKPIARAKPARIDSKPKRSNEQKTQYIYRDESGNEAYQIIRTDYIDENGKPGKTFCSVHQGKDGKPVYKEPETLYPYKLPDVLDAETIYIVEGEKTADCLNEVLQTVDIKTAIATTSQGGAQRGSLWRGFLQQFPTIADKTIHILPDNDDGGMKYARTVAAAFSAVNPEANIKLVTLPSLPEGGDFVDWYLSDFIAEGKDGPVAVETLSALCERAVAVTSNIVEVRGQDEPAETATLQSDGEAKKTDTLYVPEFCDSMLKNLNVDIFGQNEERHIYGFSYHTNRRFVIRNRNHYTLRDLIGDCGAVVDKYVVDDKSDKDGMYKVSQVCNVFVREAAKHNIRDYDLRGQGIWLDPQTKHPVIVLGGGQAATWNGTTLERRAKPFYGDLQLDFQAARAQFAGFDMLKNALENYDEIKAVAAFAELKRLLMQWNWKTRSKPDQDITVTLIAALAVASFIQSTFKFRPQVCVAGVTQSGKSSIQTQLLVPLFGRLTDTPLQKPTEAAIRQSVECNSKILLIDELEKSKGNNREEILKLLRTSTDGGYVVKGQPNGKVQRFGLKHIVWISSIEMNLANLADASRFFQFEPQRPERQGGKRTLLKLDPQIIRKIGFDLMVFAIRNMQAILQTVEELSEADIENASARNIEAAAVPAAFAEMLCGWVREETYRFMYFAIRDNSPMATTEVTEDHDDLLQSILCQSINVRNFGLLSVMQTIKKAVTGNNDTNIEYAEEALERNGITIIKPRDSDLHVFFKPNVVKDILLKNSEWKGTNVKQLLIRTDGAKEYNAKFVGKTAKGVSIPLQSIIDEEPETTSNQNAHCSSEPQCDSVEPHDPDLVPF